METTEILRKVRRIEIKTKGLSHNIFAGQYHSAFKGRGMAFSEVREYQYEDDIRDIDWNVTARFHRPFVKVFEEERELTVMLLIDVSSSQYFGTRKQTKWDMAIEIAATIAFSAIANNDKIGVIFFSDHIEKYIPPQKGRKHILYLIREMLAWTDGDGGMQGAERKTNLSASLTYLARVMKRRCTCFVLSDFFDRQDFSSSLQIVNKKHDLVAVQVYDALCRKLPDVGLLRVRDAETGHEMVIDSSDTRVRKVHEQYFVQRQAQLSSVFSKSGVDWVSIATDDDYVKQLLALFKQRN